MIPVTTDWKVAKAMTSLKLPTPSAKIAEAVGLQIVHQITARLKGMEGRELVSRDTKGRWGLTPAGFELGRGPEPPPPPERLRLPSGGGVVGLPSDEGVRRITDTRGVKLFYVWHGTHRFTIFIDKKNHKWVECHPMEAATAIREFSNGLTPMRLRPFKGSSAERLLNRHEKQLSKWKERAKTLYSQARMSSEEARAILEH